MLPITLARKGGKGQIFFTATLCTLAKASTTKLITSIVKVIIFFVVIPDGPVKSEL